MSYCMIDGDYGSSCDDFTASIVRTARKVHKCAECKEAIEPGDKYEDARGKDDGAMWTHKTCEYCLEERELVDEKLGGWLYGEVNAAYASLWREE